ncbi:ABC transporter permease [Nocardioides sp. Kera G14]|uniref:ABC transporter permease n=1 Tax=Nocardioides sp. Kera G14 TaxID=2884264 RepID=UPI001D101D90|nr:ABC transporter permease [Nocardioides sp. Kera G14]UDY23050.1 ABC transporter permease [Nocardioides sp. Kera G14]
MSSLLLGPASSDLGYRAERSPFLWLLEREVLRYLRIWKYALLGPVLSTILFVVVFGLVLSRHVDGLGDISYGQFILPGLIAQTVVNVGFFNGTTSLFDARRDRYLNDVLASPIRWWELNLALVLAATLRGLVCGGAVLAFAGPLVHVHIARPGYLAVATLALLLFSAQFGILVGALVRMIDQIYAMESLVILPLGFFGGIFYSLDQLPGGWQWISYANPFFWLVQSIREGFIGASDVASWSSLLLLWLAALGLTAAVAWLLATSRKIKP